MPVPYVIEEAAGVVNGVNTVFATLTDFATASLKVWRNGQLQQEFDANEGWIPDPQGAKTFVFYFAPPVGDVITVGYRPI